MLDLLPADPAAEEQRTDLAKLHNFAGFPEPIMSSLLDMFTASTYN